MLAAAGGSDRTHVKLCVNDVYNTSSETVSLETTNTIGDLKRLLQDTFSSRPAPSQQRLIFRGKQCEESQQLGHVLRGVSGHAWSGCFNQGEWCGVVAAGVRSTWRIWHAPLLCNFI